MANVQYRGTGRRKSSVARVILTPGTGKCEINGKAAKEYLPSDVLLMIVDQPLELTGTKDKFDVKVNVNGGGGDVVIAGTSLEKHTHPVPPHCPESGVTQPPVP